MQAVDCVIVGAGQCGLYISKCLQDAGISYLTLERDNVGDVWRNRLHGMKLFTSRRFCELPGLSFPGEQGDFPDVLEVADYLTSYQKHFSLNVVEQCAVVNVIKHDEGFYVTTVSDNTSADKKIRAKVIVNTTGSNQVGIIPDMASDLDESVFQSTADVASLETFTSEHNVVVVGAGASGRQVAGRLADQCRSVILSHGQSRGLPPNRVLGKDLFWWLKHLGILFAPADGLIAKILKKRNPVPCGEVNDKNLKKRGVKLVGRAVECNKNKLTFSCGTEHRADAVIWAIGYRDETAWLNTDNAVKDGTFIHTGVNTPVSGLFIIGRKWLSCRASELIMGVEKDVHLALEQIQAHIRSSS